MDRSQPSRRNHITLLILASLALTFLLAGCGSLTGEPGPPVSYTQGAGQVLIRLVDAPGNIFPSLRAIPEWELYGDGTLLYQPQGTRSDTLLQAQIQPADIAHILDVIVNQDAFFVDKKNLYGKATADVGQLVLSVNASKQQKTVSLLGEEGAPSEDQHMFSALHFLQSYQPASPHPYTTPGAVVLLRPYPGAITHVAPWPYPDIALQQVAAQECKTLHPNSQGSCTATSNPDGYFPIYGKRGTDLLNLLKDQQIWYMSQEGQTYAILAWPLLPENLITQADGKQWVQTEGMNGGRWPLLPGTH
ncbi:MAG: hypothetical protein J2P36_08075 [Ktedonobacteraceae bacterium]|nr:hypothetical protein [Ktedonobacteraceae bacterium]